LYIIISQTVAIKQIASARVSEISQQILEMVSIVDIIVDYSEERLLNSMKLQSQRLFSLPMCRINFLTTLTNNGIQAKI